jgi:hypothetical protein
MNEHKLPESDSGETSDKTNRFDAERIKELRERLYSRGSTPQESVRHPLTERAIHEPVVPPEHPKEVEIKEPEVAVTSSDLQEVPTEDAVLYGMTSPRRKSIRKKLLILGGLFFVVAIAISSLIMFSGNNTISGENISISATGPISVGGGDNLSFQVTIANQNAVPIQSAALIIEYPDGSRNSTDGKEISTERKQLDTVNANEVVNIPLLVKVFGEEDEEKEILVSIDYRVAGSNATFHKDAEPLKFKVSTSPLVMTFDTLKTVTSGQDMELKLTVQSNSPTELKDILVKVSYPTGFDFSESSPDTTSGEDSWKLATLKPGEKQTISIKGLMTGYENDVRKFNATAGIVQASDKNTLASILAQAEEEIVIEQAFLDVVVAVNGSDDTSVIIDPSGVAIVDVKFENTLDNTIYDGKISVVLSGNALNEFEVNSPEGFYDSTKNTITWDGVDVDSLKEILPGRKSNVSFTLDPNDNAGSAPEIKISVGVSGKRVYESDVPEKLASVAERIVKIESVPKLTATALHGSGAFVDTGPTPPVAEEVTQYTFVLRATAGSNDVTGAEVTTVLPQYVSWLDLVTDGDTVTYNPTSRSIKWTIGDMKAGSEEEVSMQVSFLPSLTQVGITPTILEAQRFKATDRFTGTVVRAEHSALTTGLYYEEDVDLRDGRVRSPGE